MLIFLKNIYPLLLLNLLSHGVQPVIFCCSVALFLDHDILEGVKEGLSYK